MAWFAQVCLSLAVLGPNLEHWDNILSSTLSLPYPLPFTIKNPPKPMYTLR